MADKTNAAKPSVDEMLIIATKQINRRRHKWTLSTYSFEDFRQDLLVHFWQKYEDKYDPEKAPLENWINSVISNQTKNALRNHLYKHAKPCGPCSYNQGGDACGYTPNGKQCAACPIFAKWQKRKEAQHNIKATLSLDAPSHAQEVSNIQSDFTDYDAAMKRIHEVMLTQLTPFERRLYRLLIIRHVPPAEASEKLKKVMKRKKLKEGEGVGYQALLQMLKTFRSMIVLVIQQEDLG